ncbi:MAG TPA: c-type cytochrome [Puia sp.]|nr:c-type cytochrome [Puia sp.]
MKAQLLILLPAVLLLTLAFAQQPKPWPVPEKFLKMSNPVKSNAESVANGKSLWGQHCASCHGKAGLGDGNKAAQLKTQLSDFSQANPVQAEPDGSLFYKIEEGRDEMPTFKKKIPDQEDVWSLVDYIRTLKK